MLNIWGEHFVLEVQTVLDIQSQHIVGGSQNQHIALNSLEEHIALLCSLRRSMYAVDPFEA